MIEHLDEFRDGPLEADDELRVAIGALRAEAPATDLWPGIRHRIEAAPATAPRRVSFTIRQLALAASLLVCVSAGVSWLAAGRSDATVAPVVRAEAETSLADSSGADRGDAQRANFADAQYDAAVSDLEQLLRNERSALDPRTVMVIERNLTTIDEAIRQARDALDADPANPYLNSHLADSRRHKLDVLRRATLLSPAS